MHTQPHLEAAKVWADATQAYTDAAQKAWWAMTSNAAELWALPATTLASATEAAAKANAKPKSWYRKPADSPMDIMMSWFEPHLRATGPAGWPAMWGGAMPARSPFDWSAAMWPNTNMMAWRAFTPPGTGFDQIWSAMQIMLATAPLQRAMAEATSQTMSAAAPMYAAYRSDGGHASTHVSMGGAARLMSMLLPMLIAATMMLIGLSTSQIA